MAEVQKIYAFTTNKPSFPETETQLFPAGEELKGLSSSEHRT